MNHLDIGTEDFMDDGRILSRGMDRGESDSHDFILDHPLFTQWLTTGVSSILNIVAGPGTGKTIMPARIYHRATKHASSGNVTPVLFNNCRHRRQNTSPTILRSLIPGIISRRSDALLVDDVLHLDYWTASYLGPAARGHEISTTQNLPSKAHLHRELSSPCRINQNSQFLGL